MSDVVAALRNRVRTIGPQPLLTCYDLDRGERTELSSVTFANWVDKTCHLYDELELGPGEQVAVPVAVERPGHWVPLVAIVAGWQVGAHVVSAPGPASLLAVVGPDSPWVMNPPTWLTVIACSLHPLGLPLGPPAPVVDFAEVLSEPDLSLSFPHSPGDLAWDDLSYADLAGSASLSGRVLVRTGDAQTAVISLVGALLGGGSVVLVAGAGDVDAIAADERATQH